MNNTSDNQESSASSLEVMPANALEAITRGEIDVQIATAHKYPRSLAVYKQRAIAMATIDIETAKSCLYARPVGGGKFAEGMSVRMAEIVGACYGNLRVGAIIIEISETQVKARGVAHDLETNFASSSDIIESTLKADGKTPYDPRMRVVVAKAAVAKARRVATFQVVPRALARPIEAEVRRLLADEKVQTFGERRERVVKWIKEKLKIDPVRVWTSLEIKGEDDLQHSHLDLLDGIRTALADGDTTVDEAFPVPLSKKPMFDKKPKAQESPLVGNATTPNTDGGKTTDSAPKPEPTSAPVTVEKPATSPGDTDEATLIALMKKETPEITAEELGRVLKSFNKAIPRRFSGPGDLTDEVLADTIKEWAEYRSIILGERGASAP